MDCYNTLETLINIQDELKEVIFYYSAPSYVTAISVLSVSLLFPTPSTKTMNTQRYAICGITRFRS